MPIQSPRFSIYYLYSRPLCYQVRCHTKSPSCSSAIVWNKSALRDKGQLPSVSNATSIYLFTSKSCRGETGGVSHSTVHSLEGHTASWGLSQERLPDFSCGSSRDVSTWAIFCCLSQNISRKLGYKWDTWDMNQCQYGMLALQVVALPVIS